MEQITLERTGREPLAFTSDVEGGTWWRTDEGGKRKHSISIFVSTGGKLVAAVNYETEWPRESNRSSAHYSDDWKDIVAWLSAYKAADDVTGFPVGEQFRANEEKVKREIIDQFKNLVSEVCMDMNWVEEID